uniref:Uncharacterized protein n=1 Tax=Plectus sambesii TaxID=2011161 RepID=A0A914WI63_9BILA
MLTIHIFVFLTAATHQLAFAARKDVDQIVSLPGLTYDVQFKQYSGYLQGTTGVNLHYWLVESQSATPSTDPLILWLNGGPGCSSVKGLIKELGPFHPNPDGVTLFENVYSWNKKANVLFVEMPKNTGFSFQNTSLNNGTTYNDETTGADTLAAVKDFFDSYPEYRTRDFYVMGVSYGGVYVPLLTNLLIKEIQAGRLTANLVGIAIGNGQLKVTQIINSNMVLLYAHGLIGKDDWDSLQKCCPNTTLVDCDFSQWLTLNTDGVPYPVNITTECGGIVADLGLARVWATLNNVYNIYQDCYQKPATSSKTSFASSEVPLPGSRSAENAFIDQGSMINWASTDAFGGYSCYADSAAERFLNTPIVRDALHIPSEAPTWQTCSSIGHLVAEL